MANRKLFVNLPVENLARSTAFFGALGFTFDPAFTDENATCMNIGEDAYAMLLVKPFFQGFSKRDLVDTSTAAQQMCAFAVGSRDEVDDLAGRVEAAGGTLAGEPEDLGFMYSQAFADPDGHLWSVFHMDMSGLPQQTRAAEV